MRTVYSSRTQELTPTGATVLYGVRVPNGKILIVKNLTVYWPGTNAADYMALGYESAGVLFHLGRAQVGITFCSGTVGGEFEIGEHDRVFASGNLTSTPAIITLSITGELWDAIEWTKQNDNKPR